MAFKVLIGQKNSKWKVVQNPLKGNFYTDVVDFRNDNEKDQFLNLNFFPDWKNLNNGGWVETPLKWHDEIHAEFTIDLEKTKFTRSDALRKDFCCVYDSNENSYKFYTMEAHLSNKQVYTTLTYVIELDLFFTYDIKKIWKDNVQVEMLRGVSMKQWDGDKPYLSIAGDLAFSEGLNAKTAVIPEISTVIGKDTIDGVVAWLSLQPRDLALKIQYLESGGGLINRTIQTRLVDTFQYFEQNTGNGLFVGYMTPFIKKDAIKYLHHTKGNWSGLFYYDDSEKITPVKTNTRFSSKKQSVLLPVFIPLNNFSDYDWIHSNDVVKLVPFSVSSIANYTLLQWLAWSTGADLETDPDTPTLISADVVNHPYIPWYGVNNNYSSLMPKGYINPASNVIASTSQLSWTFILNVNKGDLFDWSQYTKLFFGDFAPVVVVGPDKQKMEISLELTGDKAFFTQTKHVYIDGIHYVIKINGDNKHNFYDVGDVRNGWVLESFINPEITRNTSAFAQFVSQNATAINVNAKMERRDKKMAIANGTLGLVMSAGSAIAGGVAGAVGGGAVASAGQAMLGPSTEAMSVGKDLLSIEQYTPGANVYRSGLSGFNQGQQNIAKGRQMQAGGVMTGIAGIGGIVSNIEGLIKSGDQIKRTTASLTDKANVGGTKEFVQAGWDYLRNIDGDTNAVFYQTHLPDMLRNQIAMHFHKYGYNLGNTLASPLTYLSNGIYWDYFQADFNSLYQAFNENLSPQESKIAALTLSQGVRVWHWTPDIYDGWQVGDYTRRNIQK